MAERSKREFKPTLKYLNYFREGASKKAPVSIKTVSIPFPNGQTGKPTLKSSASVPASLPSTTAGKPNLTQNDARKRKIEDPESENAKRRSGRPLKPSSKFKDYIYSSSEKESKPDDHLTPGLDSTSAGGNEAILKSSKGTSQGTSEMSNTSKNPQKSNLVQIKRKSLAPHRKKVLSSPLRKGPLSSPRLKSLMATSKISRFRHQKKTQKPAGPSKGKKHTEPSTNLPKKTTPSVTVTNVINNDEPRCISTTSSVKQQNGDIQEVSDSTNDLYSTLEETFDIPMNEVKTEEEVSVDVTPTVETAGPSSSNQELQQMIRKFLLMGTKVAHSISKSLKQNESSLFSSTSTFEKKCLNLVHAIAEQGQDLEADDMEKILNLLDEEHEERKAYRQCLLQNLKVAHLTNMALYTQMLKLLKSL